jgi:DNA-binding winged helix-turn-helix (wHTH) protein/TolB-like protein/tetratricopeptide (TPR) repeat protein
MELKTIGIYVFGPFRLEPAEHRLLCRGEPVSLTPKSFELLVYLVENHGRLVLKDQIMRAVWPGSFVEEANLTVSISALRKVLGKTADGLQYIETIPTKGYRFSVPVEQVRNLTRSAAVANGTIEPESNGTQALAVNTSIAPATDEGHPPSVLPEPQVIATAATPPTASSTARKLTAIALLFCVACAAGYLIYWGVQNRAHSRSAARTLAILPLQNLRQDPDSDFLGFSLVDAVITKLAVVNSVTVRPSSVIKKYRGREVDIKKVAMELNVDTVLTGNFIRDGNHLRITYQLFDVPTFKILSNDVVDVTFDALLSVHDNVAAQVVKGLQLDLSPLETERLKSDIPVSPLAYEYYLRGVDLMAAHNFPLAVKMLEKSAEIDPKYPLTWAYLGQSYTSDATFELGGTEQYRRAQAAYERALSLQPGLLEAEMFLGNLLIDTGKVEEAVPLLRKAIALQPDNAALHWELGYAYRFAGMLQQSVAECELARRIDPSAKSNGSVLNTYLYLGQYQKFLESLPDVNASGFFRFYRGFAEYHLGKLAEASEDFNRAYKEDPTLYTQIGKALADSIANNNSSGLQILQKLENGIRQRGVGDPEATYKIAQAYSAMGDLTSGLRTLRTSIEAGFFSYPYFLRDPLLNNLRSAPEFQQLLDMAQQRHEAFRKTFF